MQLVPDWAPNIHPMIVHFPLVLLILAVLLDQIGLVLTKFDWIKKSSLLLYFLGTIATVIAFLTGNAASDSIDIPANAFTAVNDHTDMAEITLWFFIVYTIIRFSVGIFLKSLTKTVVIPIVILGVLGIYFLYQTGDRGAKLVFGYGLGTGNIIKQGDETKGTTSKEQIADSTFTVHKNGSWKLIPDAGIIKTLSGKFKWIEGSLEELSPMFDPDEAVLMLHPKKQAMFVYDNKIKSVQVTEKVNVDDLNGELELIHHFIDKDNYDFLSIGKGKISLSRKSKGQVKIFEEDNYSNTGWIDIKVVSDGSHFRCYINNEMIVHGHGSEPNPGSVGMRVSGAGSFSIKMINVESL